MVPTTYLSVTQRDHEKLVKVKEKLVKVKVINHREKNFFLGIT